MSPSFIIVSYSLLFLLLFTLSLFLYIVFRRIILEHQKIKFEKQYQAIEKDVLDAISSNSAELALQAAQKYKSSSSVLVQVLVDYAEVLAGQGRDQLKIIFDHALKEKCLKDLNSRWTIKRLKVTRLFVIFCGPAGTSHLLKLLNDKPIVKLTAITALSRVPTPKTLSFIFQAFEKDSGPPVRSYFNIMFGLGNRIEFLVKEYLKKPLSTEKLGLLIELVGAIPIRNLYDEINAFRDHPDKEIRTKVARALGKMLLPDSVNTLITLASDEAWEVQAQALKALGNLQNPMALDILIKALFSPSWHVRRNAGYALANMGEEGLRRLREVTEQKEDRYAADMAVMVLNDLIYFKEAG